MAAEPGPTTADPSYLNEMHPPRDEVILVEMAPAAPVTAEEVLAAAHRAAEGGGDADPSRLIARAAVVIGRWGEERGDADGNDLGHTFCLVARDPVKVYGRALVLDATHLAPEGP